LGSSDLVLLEEPGAFAAAGGACYVLCCLLCRVLLPGRASSDHDFLTNLKQLTNHSACAVPPSCCFGAALTGVAVRRASSDIKLLANVGRLSVTVLFVFAMSNVAMQVWLCDGTF
jgi:hypothetical protein